MIVSEACRNEIKFFCPLCGTNNVSEDGKITECSHYEGTVSMGEIEFDKNGIIKKASEKENEIFEQMVNLVNEKSKKLDLEYDEVKEISEDERKEYWRKINTIIKECYERVGWPQNVPVNQIQGNSMVSTLDVLKTQLDDSYFAFYSWEGALSGADGFNLYHLIEVDNDEE